MLLTRARGFNANGKQASVAVRSNDPMRAKTLSQIVAKRKIKHLVHFTRLDNLPSIMQHGLLSRTTMERSGVEYYPTDEVRLDRKPHAISLSVSSPNEKMFYKKRQENGANVQWVVFLLDPKLLWEKNCAFYPTNAANSRYSRLPLEQCQTTAAFEEMFLDTFKRRSFLLGDCYTTDVQAEVMLFGTIETKYIQNVVFDNASLSNLWMRELDMVGLNARCDTQFFEKRNEANYDDSPFVFSF